MPYKNAPRSKPVKPAVVMQIKIVGRLVTVDNELSRAQRERYLHAEFGRNSWRGFVKKIFDYFHLFITAYTCLLTPC